MAHVWVVAIMLAAARRTEWIGGWQVALGGAAVAMLWAWTCVLDTLSESPKREAKSLLMGQSFWQVSGRGGGGDRGALRGSPGAARTGIGIRSRNAAKMSSADGSCRRTSPTRQATTDPV